MNKPERKSSQPNREKTELVQSGKISIEELELRRDVFKVSFAAEAERVIAGLKQLSANESVQKAETTLALLAVVEDLVVLMGHMQAASLWSHWNYYSEYFFTSVRADGSVHNPDMPSSLQKVCQNWRAFHILHIRLSPGLEKKDPSEVLPFDESVMMLVSNLKMYHYLQMFVLVRQATELATGQFFQDPDNTEEFAELVPAFVSPLRRNDYGTFDASQQNVIYAQHLWYYTLVLKYYNHLSSKIQEFKPDFLLEPKLIHRNDQDPFELFIKQLKYDFVISQSPIIHRDDSAEAEHVQMVEHDRAGLNQLAWFLAYQTVGELVTHVCETRKQDAELDEQFKETGLANLLRSLL